MDQLGRYGGWDGPRGRCHREQADRRRESAADQPAPQPFAAPGQPALDGADGPAQAPGRLFVRESLQVAEHDRDAASFRQPVDLFVEDA